MVDGHNAEPPQPEAMASDTAEALFTKVATLTDDRPLFSNAGRCDVFYATAEGDRYQVLLQMKPIEIRKDDIVASITLYPENGDGENDATRYHFILSAEGIELKKILPVDYKPFRARRLLDDPPPTSRVPWIRAPGTRGTWIPDPSPEYDALREQEQAEREAWTARATEQWEAYKAARYAEHEQFGLNTIYEPEAQGLLRMLAQGRQQTPPPEQPRTAPQVSRSNWLGALIRQFRDIFS